MMFRRRRRASAKKLHICSNRELSVESLEPRRVLDSTVVINEIMYNPAGPNDGLGEWIELYNQLRVDMDISEWQLRGAVDFDIPDGTVVPGNGHLVIAANPESFEQSTGVAALGPWEGFLSNGGEEIRLYNNDRRVMNRVDYDDQGDWPVTPDGAGASLAKLERNTSSERAASWTFSEQLGGTPGAANFGIRHHVRLDRHVDFGSPVRAIVPSDGSWGRDWIANDFDDSSWLQGTTGVGFDQSTRNPAYLKFLGLDLDNPPDGQAPMPMRNVNGSAYLRMPFEVVSDIDAMRFAVLRMRYEDGFVAYLNGTEIARVNAPLDEELSWDSTATGSRSSTVARLYQEFDIENYRQLFQPGRNVLAIQIMNSSVRDKDVLVDAQLVTKSDETFPLSDKPAVYFNEVGREGSPFFVEIVNRESGAVEISSFAVLRPGEQQSRYSLPDVSLGPGEVLAVDAATFGGVDVGDRFVLLDARDRILDGVRVADQIQARSWSQDGIWQTPRVATAGEANAFELHDEIVINEIMYHPAGRAPVPDVAPVFDSQVLIPLTHSAWRFDDSGNILPTGWQMETHPAWTTAQAPIGFDSDELKLPINTQITKPSNNRPLFVTYYFETEFEITNEVIDEVDQLTLTHMLDDGAVFYVNGQEVHRYNILSGPVSGDDVAIVSVPNAAPAGPFVISSELLVPGVNTFSAELHLSTPKSGDVVFAGELAYGRMLTPGIPSTAYDDREELEWIELYNNSDQSVDLSDWRLADAIDFEFPAGTMVEPREFFVVAQDLNAFQATYPGVQVVGQYDGRLSNHDERIQLLDANQNLADEVTYFESGRWPELADGGGSSLELIDADADNRRAEVWAASDERHHGVWTPHTFRGVSKQDVFFGEEVFNEFALGLLDNGEFLIDDVRVVMDPDGGAIPLIQNGTFDSDTIGASPDKWRTLGNHSGVVVADPDDAANQVLHVTATGAQAFVHDHLETTFIDNRDIVDGEEYEISFRAKWLNGNSQINSRIWFNRVPNTMQMERSLDTGSPGKPNPAAIDNFGPTYTEFLHAPTTPRPHEVVTVQVRPEDPDGVGEVTLWWRENGQPWSSTLMQPDDLGLFHGEIPAYGEATIVQFYVESLDGLGNRTTYPAAGPDSRALYQVEDGRETASAVDRYRWIMLDEEKEDFFKTENRMSNWFMPVTFVQNDKSFYDVEMRLVGSRFSRPGSGYKIRLDPDDAMYGVHDSVRFDTNGIIEIAFKQLLNRAGGSKSTSYDDLTYLVSSGSGSAQHTLLQLARYENTFLDEQFVDGSQGTKWELDDVVVASHPQGGVEGVKTGTLTFEDGDIGIDSLVVAEQGSNPEFYRGHLVIKNNRDLDDYATIVRFATAIHKNGDELFDATNEVLDVDQWMRYYAYQSYFGAWDTYGFTRPKNIRFYLRPVDNKVIPLMWDIDLADLQTGLLPKTVESRMDEIRDIPHNFRLFWGHMLDMVGTAFNVEYIEPWVDHFRELALNNHHSPKQRFVTFVDAVRRRTSRTLDMLEDEIPRVDFEILTNGGEDLVVDTSSLTLSGKGWVDVRQIRIAGSDQPLNAFWPTTDEWQIELPLASGSQTIQLEAVNFDGAVIAVDSINVESPTANPVLDSLRINEVQYNPADSSFDEQQQGFDNNDDFEYIELINIGSVPISLDGVQLVRTGREDSLQGVDFKFSEDTTVASGDVVVVVENADAFQSRYGSDKQVAGQWSGRLSNAAEQITLVADGVTVQQFSYTDDWWPTTDGSGHSLQIVDAAATDLEVWGTAAGWRPSSAPLGTPGLLEFAPGDANGDGVFNEEDLTALFIAGEYNDDVPNNSTFAEGDFNGDGDFDSEDLVWAFRFGRYTPGGAPAVLNELKPASVDSVFRDTSSHRSRMAALVADDSDEHDGPSRRLKKRALMEDLGQP